MSIFNQLRINRTYLTDVLCNRAEVWHLWGDGLLVVHPDARCPQAELLGGSIQLHVVDNGLHSLEHFCTSLEVDRLKGKH